jgi:cysteinyl-tRNA synthetase
LTADDLTLLKQYFHAFLFDILGMKPQSGERSNLTDALMSVVLDIRQEAKLNKNWAVADTIRDRLTQIGIVIKDTKEGAVWEQHD